MKRVLSSLLAGAVVLAMGCTSDNSTAPSMVGTNGQASIWDGGTAVQAMTQNVYVGADVDKVIAALASPDPSDDLPALLNAIEVLRNTDFGVRATAIAGQIAVTRPHVIGLQEISKIDIDLLLPGQEAGISVHLDYLPILMQALTARGLNYAVGAIHEEINAAPFAGVSLKDYDVILYDANRVVVGPEDHFGRLFRNNLGMVAPGVYLTRGMVGIRAHMGERQFYVLNTHLESGFGAPSDDALRLAQAQELVEVLRERPHAILMGDFNSTETSPAYAYLRQHDLKDMWIGLNPGYPGYTCCQLGNLRNELPRLTQRIDFIFARGVGETPAEYNPWIKCVGDDSRDRFAGPFYPLWPSDHAGVVAFFELHGR